MERLLRNLIGFVTLTGGRWYWWLRLKVRRVVLSEPGQRFLLTLEAAWQNRWFGLWTSFVQGICSPWPWLIALAICLTAMTSLASVLSAENQRLRAELGPQPPYKVELFCSVDPTGRIAELEAQLREQKSQNQSLRNWDWESGFREGARLAYLEQKIAQASTPTPTAIPTPTEVPTPSATPCPYGMWPCIAPPQAR